METLTRRLHADILVLVVAVQGSDQLQEDLFVADNLAQSFFRFRPLFITVSQWFISECSLHHGHIKICQPNHSALQVNLVDYKVTGSIRKGCT